MSRFFYAFLLVGRGKCGIEKSERFLCTQGKGTAGLTADEQVYQGGDVGTEGDFVE